MRTLILLIIFSFYALAGCKKNKQASIQSENSVNKFSFKIDGQLWESSDVQGGIWQNGINDVRYIYLFSNKGSEGIYIFLNRPFVTGTKLLNETTEDRLYTAYPKNYGSFTRYVSGSPRRFWMTNDIDTGHCTITYIDSIRNLMKGDFAFHARDQQTGEVITISNGHFEMTIR
jgi:hypothetical protein